MSLKKIVIWFVFLLQMIAMPLFGANISFNPLYSDERFQPTDKLHAWCEHSADIVLNNKWKDISVVHLVLWYNPNDLQITRLVTDSQIQEDITYSIEYNKIIFNYLNSKNNDSETTILFKLLFKSDENTTWSQIKTLTWSYFLDKAGIKNPIKTDFNLEFAKTPECQPDIISPSINLVFPKEDMKQKITLDQYFIFEVKDIGKWVDKLNTKVSINWDDYSLTSENLKWNWNYLIVYPKDWLTINKNIEIKIEIWDKQIYWWANIANKTFSFKTTNGFSLQNNINPNTFRQIIKWAEKIFWSTQECQILNNTYQKADWNYQIWLKSVLDKLACNTDNSIIFTWDIISQNHWSADLSTENKKIKFVSVFASIWRILFFITFGLKIHYLLSYRKHKKIAKFYKDANNINDDF